MSFKSVVRELKEMRDGIGNMSRRGGRAASGNGRGGAARPQALGLQSLHHPCPWWPERQQGKWADLPTELLQDVIKRVETSEASWPARRHVVACAAVCRSWREVTKEIVQTPEQCGRITFPISLKQVSSSPLSKDLIKIAFFTPIWGLDRVFARKVWIFI